MATKKPFPVVYRSLEQAVKVLRISEVSKTTEVHQLLKICSSAQNGILEQYSFEPRRKPVSVIKSKLPFIVMEGLDGSGKTKVSTYLSEKLGLVRYGTPPERIKFLKDFFDEQRECVRRAYYSVGNYLMAQEIGNTNKGLKGIILDRYWHSTAAYGASQKLNNSEDDGSFLPEDWFHWPNDLQQPQLVIFLVVSEKVRQYRHAFRNTTNTKEEQAIASNPAFRESLIECYGKIQGPPCLQLMADGEIEDVYITVEENVIKKFPILNKSSSPPPNPKQSQAQM